MKNKLNCNEIISQSKSIYLTKGLISAISVLKESDQSDSAYIRYCVQETIKRDHGFPFSELFDPIVRDRILRGDLTLEQGKKMLAIFLPFFENKLSDIELNELKELSFTH